MIYTYKPETQAKDSVLNPIDRSNNEAFGGVTSKQHTLCAINIAFICRN